MTIVEFFNEIMMKFHMKYWFQKLLKMGHQGIIEMFLILNKYQFYNMYNFSVFLMNKCLIQHCL